MQPWIWQTTHRLIGLTGGIASGKSTVSRLLRNHGAIVIDADQVARSVVEPRSEGLRVLVDRWGSSILTPAGALDRTRMGELIFNDPQERKALEAIMHPLIAQESERRIKQAITMRAPLVIYDAALLFEVGRAEQFRPVVVVACNRDTQISRIMHRDQCSQSTAESRIKAQMSVEEKINQADYVIENNGTMDDLRSAVHTLWSWLGGPVKIG